MIKKAILFIALMIALVSNSEAALLSDGLESGDFSAFSSTSYYGTATVTIESTSPIYSGAYSAQFEAAQYGGAIAEYSSSTPSEFYARSFFYIPSGGRTSYTCLMYQEDGDFTFSSWVCMSASNQIDLYNDANFTSYTSGVSPNFDAWNCLEWHFLVSDTVGVAEVWLNGIRIINQTGIDTKVGTSGVVGYLSIGVPYNDDATTWTIHADNIVISDQPIGCRRGTTIN